MDNNPDHLFVTPVSVADGLKRGDGKTWAVLLITGAIGVVLVLLFNVIFEKTPVQWSAAPVQETAGQNPVEQKPTEQAEPRAFDVAPPGEAPRRP
jgi:hypothetical protein